MYTVHNSFGIPIFCGLCVSSSMWLCAEHVFPFLATDKKFISLPITPTHWHLEPLLDICCYSSRVAHSPHYQTYILGRSRLKDT
ncbi:hypothetical protein B0H12DRAFT_218882 [Mycena haematopus]|nr:hypothetical protein B0H12DRAFT_218882 [Mycena haematopus]